MKDKKIELLEDELSSIENDKEEFIEKFKVNAAYALSWSESMFASAAKEKIFKDIVHGLKADTSTLEGVTKYVLGRIVSLSSRQSHSTMQTANLIEQYELAAWSKAYEILT